MKKLSVLLCALLAAATIHAQDWMRLMSRVEYRTIHSERLGADRSYSVFLPAGYDADTTRRYPVLYLLHGMNDNNRSWYERGHVKDVMDQLTASGEVCPMIIVTPNAGGNIAEGNWNGYFDMEGWPYESFFFGEFVPAVEREFRIMADKSHRAVAGLSMGGGGATSYALRHSDMFCACYAMSALMHLPAPEGPAAPADDKMRLLTAAVNRLSCVDYARNADENVRRSLRSVAWFVDCGDDDFLFDCNIDFVQALKRGQIPCQLRVRDGGHTWEYWHSALYTALPFFTRQFGK